uniref:Ig-like domain-containing protein n=1 Tax=Branchiostoma floridae TaxID=7739 RepID=C3XS60_BRAFL|eukprot:XP_002613519.1 hypothetical protein BRAFLDRAFT_71868 [Branchiostoma floridae]
MAMKLTSKVCLLLLSQLLVHSVDAGSWQGCREVSVAKCGVGDSGLDGRQYRYDIAAYRYKWTKYPREVASYEGPFQTVTLSQKHQSCQVCSNETKPTTGGPTGNQSQQGQNNIMIVDTNVGKLGTDKAELLSQIPCGRDCRLWFVGCNLTEIEGGAFAKLPQVSTLVIWRSNVQTLRNDTFAGMEGLKYLLLLENNLTHLEDGCFDGLPGLSFLILVDNRVLMLSPDTFRGVHPPWLDVSANHLTSVAPGTLQAIKSVEHVRAAENKLRAIGAGMFHGLERLRILILEGNRISHIAAGAFHSNTKLSILNLAGNRLTFLSGGWFKSSFPSTFLVRGNAIAAMALEGRALKFRRVILDNPPRCTCANDWLYDHEGLGPFKFGQRHFLMAIRVPSSASCPASPVTPSALSCPAPLVEIANVKRNAAQKYEAVGSVYWEQLPRLSCAFPNGSRHALDITYDTNTTTHARLPTGNLTVSVVTDLKAEGWEKCTGPAEHPFWLSGNHSLCSNYMGKSSFTMWLKSTEPLAFANTTCTASSKTGSHTAVFMMSEHVHSGISTPHATELSLMNTTPPANITTTPLPRVISTTPVMSTSANAYVDLTWYIVFAAIGLSSPVAALGVWGCVSCNKRRLKRKALKNATSPNRNGNQITACSRWPVGDHGNVDESVISPYAEGRFEDHDSLNESESVISPYAQGGFQDHPDLRRADSSQSEIVPYGLAKICAVYAGRARAQTHPVLSCPYSTKRPRQTPNRAGAVVAAYGQNGRENAGKSGRNCYRHPIILPNPGATRFSAYQQSARAAQGSHKAPCYNSPALANDRERTLSSTYDQHDPREAAQGSRKAPCYNAPTLVNDRERAQTNTYGQHDPIEVVCNSARSPTGNSYEPAVSPSSETGAQSAIYDENHRRQPTTGRGDGYVCPSPAASADRSPAATYSQNDRREAINDTPESPKTNTYEASSPDTLIH